MSGEDIEHLKTELTETLTAAHMEELDRLEAKLKASHAKELKEQERRLMGAMATQMDALLETLLNRSRSATQ